MSRYRPTIPFNTPMTLLIPTTTMVSGVAKKTYAESDVIFCGFRTFGGTENLSNGVYTVIDTATVDTWYRPDINADCRLQMDSGDTYEIVGDPEDILQQHQFLKIRVKKVGGKP